MLVTKLKKNFNSICCPIFFMTIENFGTLTETFIYQIYLSRLSITSIYHIYLSHLSSTSIYPSIFSLFLVFHCVCFYVYICVCVHAFGCVFPDVFCISFFYTLYLLTLILTLIPILTLILRVAMTSAVAFGTFCATCPVESFRLIAIDIHIHLHVY